MIEVGHVFVKCTRGKIVLAVVEEGIVLLEKMRL
jgi:hypothetical protein